MIQAEDEQSPRILPIEREPAPVARSGGLIAAAKAIIDGRKILTTIAEGVWKMPEGFAKTGGGVGGTLGGVGGGVLISLTDWPHHIGRLYVLSMRAKHPDWDPEAFESISVLAQGIAGLAISLGCAFVGAIPSLLTRFIDRRATKVVMKQQQVENEDSME